MRCVLVLTLAVTLFAQDSRFAARSRLVVLPVSVADAKGADVPGLEASDFVVLDGGRPQKIAVETIDTGVAPIALAIAVESAGISRAALANVRRVGAMIQPLVTGQRGCAGVLTFNERIDWLEDCTKDPEALTRAFQRIPEGYSETKARMLDAAWSAIEHLRHRENSRRVLLLIAETRDRGSETSLDAVTAAAQAAGVSIYTLNFNIWATAFTSKAPVGPQKPQRIPTTPSEAMNTWDGAPPNKFNPKIPPPEQRVDFLAGIRELAHMGQRNAAESLTRDTGGTVDSFTKLEGLEKAIQKFGENLHSQYVLTFVPDLPEPGYHALEVKIKRPGVYQVRARRGYRILQEGN